jgi:hypothetical protein
MMMMMIKNNNNSNVSYNNNNNNNNNNSGGGGGGFYCVRLHCSSSHMLLWMDCTKFYVFSIWSLNIFFVI